MSNSVYVLTALVYLSGLAPAADPPPSPWIVVPDNPPAPTPPAPPPDAVVNLPADVLYVLDCKDKVFFTVMPAGVLTVDQVPGPFAAFGRFYGGKDTPELRQFPGPQVLIVRATGPGQAMLHVIRSGATGSNDVFTRTIVSGTGPQPPPGPGPGPGPDPDPFADATPGLKVLMIYDPVGTEKLPSAQLAAMSAGPIRDYLNAHCAKEANGWPAFRVWRSDVPLTLESTLWQKAMTVPRKSLPWILVGNGKNGYSGPLPATPEATLALIQKYGGQ